MVVGSRQELSGVVSGCCAAAVATIEGGVAAIESSAEGWTNTHAAATTKNHMTRTNHHCYRPPLLRQNFLSVENVETSAVTTNAEGNANIL